MFIIFKCKRILEGAKMEEHITRNLESGHERKGKGVWSTPPKRLENMLVAFKDNNGKAVVAFVVKMNQDGC